MANHFATHFVSPELGSQADVEPMDNLKLPHMCVSFLLQKSKFTALSCVILRISNKSHSTNLGSCKLGLTLYYKNLLEVGAFYVIEKGLIFIK